MDVIGKLTKLVADSDVLSHSPVKIFRLADYLANNGVTVQEWISVKDRLPESMEWVLCYCRGNIVEVLRHDHIMDDWDTTMPNRAYMKDFVTHWMPLPKPPKGE